VRTGTGFRPEDLAHLHPTHERRYLLLFKPHTEKVYGDYIDGLFAARGAAGVKLLKESDSALLFEFTMKGASRNAD
jgi:hypothetical protein